MKLAIVGGGVAGMSASFYARKLKPDLHITVFEEKEEVGGRVKTWVVGDISDELGGTFFHPVNKLLAEMIKSSGLKTKPFSLRPAVFDGSKFVYRGSSGKLRNGVQVVRTFGFGPALKMNSIVTNAKKSFLRLYQNKTPYLSIEEIIETGGMEDWPNALLTSFLADQGLPADSRLVRHLIEPAVRYIYCQNLNSFNAFAGLVSLIAGDGSTISKVLPTNQALVQKILQQSANEVKTKCKATSVGKVAAGFELTYTNPHDEERSERFDSVILATPLELSEIQLLNIEVPPPLRRDRPFKTMHVSVFEGRIKPERFGSPNHIPDLIMTTSDSNLPFLSIENLGKGKTGQSLFNVFSSSPLSQTQVEEFFEVMSELRGWTWTHAYPIKTPVEQPFIPFKLQDNLCYTSGIESLSSTMETSALAGKNAAELLLS